MARRLLLDLRPLRASADFRRLYAGSVVSQVGGMMTVFAVALQVYLPLNRDHVGPRPPDLRVRVGRCGN